MADSLTPHASGSASALFQSARKRIASLRGTGRDAGTGLATEGNTLALKTGEHPHPTLE